MPNLRALLVACAIVGATGPVVGCAGRNRDIDSPDAPLGRVIVYRNGVAYFERKAVVSDELTLNVPRDRVDDFLKSLTVVDAKTGKSLPLSYPTTRTVKGHWIQMKIALPPGRREVRIAYVTESPAWKPSYRVILDNGNEARLQSWAIVDNVSGEAWKRVQVGVGSTSALSFRYDLHSVQMVERETIDGATRLAQAPPEGGSPYAVDGEKVRVLANLDPTQIEETTNRVSLAGASAAETVYRVDGANANNPSFGVTADALHSLPSVTTNRDFALSVEAAKKQEAKKQEPPKPPPSTGLGTLTAELANDEMRVRVEGFALPGDDDRAREALRRANTVRESLVARGIAAERIDVVGHEALASSGANVVRVVAVEQEAKPAQARSDDDDGKPRESAHFVAEGPMTIEAGHSAMVTLFDEATQAQQVYLYDPVSHRGSKKYAFNAVRVVNPSDNMLDSGPITVYAKQRFLGEGLTEPIPPRSSAIVPFGLDRSIVIDQRVDTREEIESLRKIERGIATTETRRIRRTELELANRGQSAAKLYVRHHVPSGWTLRDPPKDIERMRGDVLVPVMVDAGQTVRVALEESMPITTAIDLRSGNGLRAVEVFMTKGRIDPELEEDLEAILAAQRTLHDVEDELASRKEQLSGLRERVNELTVQLMALRKVGRAQSLSGHLAKRARQLGDRADDVAAEVTDLETKRLEKSIEVDTLVAELTLSTSSG